MLSPSENIFTYQRLPICFQNSFLKTNAQLIAKILWPYAINSLLYGGAIYKRNPSDLDFFVAECATEEIDALFRYLKYKKDPSNTPPLCGDLEYNLVSAIASLLNRKNIQLVDVYKKNGRNVMKITVTHFPADIIFSTGSVYTHAHEVDFALGGVHYDINADCLLFYTRQAWEDYLHNELNYLYPDKIKKDPTILLRTIRALPTSVIPLSQNSQHLIHDHLSQNKAVFSTVGPDRLYYDIKLSFFSGYAVINLQNLRHFQLFDQLFGYTIPPSEDDLKLQQYLIDEIAFIIDKNPSAYHPSLWYYAVHWTKIKNVAYQDPIFKHLSSYSQPTISIPLEALENPIVESQSPKNTEISEKIESPKQKKKRNYSPNEILTAAIDQSHRSLLTQLEKQYYLCATTTTAPQTIYTASIHDTANSVQPLTCADPTSTNVITPQAPTGTNHVSVRTTTISPQSLASTDSSTIIPRQPTYADRVRANTITSQQSTYENTVKVIKIESVNNHQTSPHKDLLANKQAKNEQENVRPNIPSNKKKRLRVKSPLMTEENSSYEELCQRGNHFLTPQYESPLNAIVYFQSAQEMSPDLPAAYVGLAKAAEIESEQKKHMVELSRHQYQKMAERVKQNPKLKSRAEDWRKNYTHQYNVMIGKYIKASTLYKKTLTKNPDDKNILSERLESILQTIEAQKNAHEKTKEISNITNTVKKVKTKVKNTYQPATPKSVNSKTADIIPDVVERDLNLLEPIAQTDIGSRKTDSDKNSRDLALALHAQEQGNFSAAKESYQIYLSKKQKTNTPSYRLYYALSETLRNQIYHGKPTYQLSEPNKSAQIDLLQFLIACYAKAISYLRTPQFYDAHIRIAEIKLDLTDYQSALDILKPIFDAPPEKCGHHYSRERLADHISDAYEKNKAYEKAAEYCRLAIQEAELKKNDVTTMKSKLAKIEKRQRAIEQLNRIKAENTNKVAFMFKTVIKHQQEKQYKEAIETCLSIIKLEKKYLPAYRKLIVCYVELGNHTEAIHWCNFLIDIDEVAYKKDYLPVQEDALMSYEHHQLVSRCQRGKVYLQSARGDSQIIKKGYDDYRSVIAIYRHSNNPSLKENLAEIMASSCLILGRNSQLLAKKYREAFEKKMRQSGCIFDSTIILNQIITQSIEKSILLQNNTQSSSIVETTTIFEVISQQRSKLFSHVTVSEMNQLSQRVYQIIHEEQTSLFSLDTAMCLTPDEFHVYITLGALEKSRGQIDSAKNYYLTALEKLEKIDIESIGSPSAFANFSHLALSVNAPSCALQFLRTLSGITTEKTPTSPLLAAQDRDWINFSEKFYQKAIGKSPIYQWSQNSYMIAIINYIQQEYPSAISIFSNIINGDRFDQTQSDQREILFYCGKSYQNLGLYDNAQNCYEGVCQQESYESDNPHFTQRLRDLGQIALKEIAALQQNESIVNAETASAVEKVTTSIGQFILSTCKMRLFKEETLNEEKQDGPWSEKEWEGLFDSCKIS